MGDNSTNKPSQSQANQATNNTTTTTAETTPVDKPITKGKSLANGFGNISHQIQEIITNIEDKIDIYYYGKGSSNFLIGKNGKFNNPLDYGLINIVKLFSSIDLCSLFTYLASSTSISGNNFDPEKNKNEISSTYGRAKYNLQNTAYKVQGLIDKYYSDYVDFNSLASKTALGDLLAEIKQFLESLVSVDSTEVFKNPELLQAFPQIKIFENAINNILAYYSKYSDITNLPQEDVQKVIKYINKTRETCIAIQALSTPKNITQFADLIGNGEIQKQLKKLDKLIDPKTIAKTIKSILNTLTSIQKMCNQIISYVNLGRLVIQVCLILIFILKSISQFLKVLGVPNVFTFLGLSTTMAEANGKLVNVIDYFKNRLEEISIVLDSLFNLINDIILKLQEISDNLKLVLRNLEDCDNMEPSLVSEMRDAIKNLDSTINTFNNYINAYDNNRKSKNNSFGEYTISILEEELTDNNIIRKRRYGVALDKLGQVVIKSTPTFASDDNVIIQEVKLLLISKKLVNISGGVLTADELRLYENASSYLEDPAISIDALDQINIDVMNDDSDNEDEDNENEDSLNINAFVNKLKGGRRLRRRMRLTMAKQKKQLNDSLQKADPNNKIKNKNTAKIRRSAIEDEIKANEELIKIYESDIKKYMVLIATNPSSKPIYMPLIKKRKDQIKDLKNRNKELKTTLISIK